MDRRKNHKILRRFKNGSQLENTFETSKTEGMNTVFSPSAENILVHYSNGIRHCVIDEGFPYFYTLEQDGSFSFSATGYSSIGFIASDHYSNFEEVFAVFKKLNTLNSAHAEQFFIDAYEHFTHQKNATFTYSYNLGFKDLENDVHGGDHVVIYDIKGEFNLNMEFHFLDSTIVLRCKYSDSKKTKNKVKIYSGDFESVCKHIFKEAEIFSCLEDDIIDFDSDLNELFRLSEIVDF
jgi:hypothetical protein